MSCIFCQCSSLKKIDLSNVTFDNVCDISFMFYGCSSLEEINTLKFKSKKTIYMNSMFSQYISLKKVMFSEFNT